jgi:hypothetical protein
MQNGLQYVVRRIAAVLMTLLALSTALPVSAQCPGDVIPNGSVNGTDLAELLATWGPCAGCPADLDGSGSVGGSDLAVILGAWGPCAPIVTTILPNVGPVGGGMPITITGD